MEKEFVRIKCKTCMRDIGFAVNPNSIPVTWCDICVRAWRESYEREYEHADD